MVLLLVGWCDVICGLNGCCSNLIVSGLVVLLVLFSFALGLSFIVIVLKKYICPSLELDIYY